jgi:hypothetical protein
MNELIFMVEEAPEGGFPVICREAISLSLFASSVIL